VLYNLSETSGGLAGCHAFDFAGITSTVRYPVLRVLGEGRATRPNAQRGLCGTDKSRVGSIATRSSTCSGQALAKSARAGHPRTQLLVAIRQISNPQIPPTRLEKWSSCRFSGWGKAGRLRRFIAVYAEKTSKWTADKQSHYKEWIARARQQGDRVDPFVSEKPVSVLDRKTRAARLVGVP
jgi:hypothetical protein